MKIILEVDSANSEDMFSAIEMLSTLIEKREAGAPVEAAPKKAAAKPAAKPAAEAETKPQAEKSEYTVDDIRAKVKELIQAGQRAGVKELLEKFGAPSATKLKKKDFADFMAAAAEL